MMFTQANRRNHYWDTLDPAWPSQFDRLMIRIESLNPITLLTKQPDLCWDKRQKTQEQKCRKTKRWSRQNNRGERRGLKNSVGQTRRADYIYIYCAAKHGLLPGVGGDDGLLPRGSTIVVFTRGEVTLWAALLPHPLLSGKTGPDSDLL